MSVARVTEISSTSPQSFEDAVKRGVSFYKGAFHFSDRWA